MILIVLLSLFGAAAASECSSGDLTYMCKNVRTCWSELAFSSQTDLQLLCEAQGFTFGDGGGKAAENSVMIRSPPQNITVREGVTAAFRCSADYAIRVTITKRTEIDQDAALPEVMVHANPSTQTTIQEIEGARYEHEGWYVCTAFGADGTLMSAEAYLRIRDICKDNNCVDPKVCKSDQYTDTYECVCPSDCSNDFVPVCGSNCESYFNECTMKKEACEKGLIGITVLSQGMCNFAPSPPEWLIQPSGGKFKEGAQISFMATASGTPEPGYKWFVNKKLVFEGPEYTGQMSASLKGKWKVVASNCYSNVIKHTFNIDIEASELKKPDTSCCKVYGDPHILTFDQKAYDYMGQGSFILAQEKTNALWQVYGTFEKCGAVTKDVSCITSITVFYKSTMVQFLRMWRVNHNGDEFSIPMGQTKNIGGLEVENKNMKYFITIGDTGVKVTWDGIVTTQICIPPCAGGVIGLCGDADCDDSNELSRRGFMSPYTRSWEAKNSAEFSNSWSVDPDIGKMEPEDGSLAPERTRPCDALPAGIKAGFESRCQQVMDLAEFDVVSLTTINTQLSYDNCVFDSCAGLVWGAGCDNAGDSQCSAEIESKIAQAMAAGMSRADAIAMYQPIPLDPACMMGIALANELADWGATVGSNWRGSMDPLCPSDEEISRMKLCPTA